jgi:hypothetical protein
MLDAYIDFIKELFPSINPYTAEQAKASLRQFYERHKEFVCFTRDVFDELSQGDIIGELPFRTYNDEGEETEYSTLGIVLSNSCDIDNDNQILIAPLIPVKSMKLDIGSIKNNTYYSLLSFPDYRLSEYVADLNLITPFPKILVSKTLKEKKEMKKYSLNLIGYYLLISKITVHFLRPEDSGTQKRRKIPE